MKRRSAIVNDRAAQIAAIAAVFQDALADGAWGPAPTVAPAA